MTVREQWDLDDQRRQARAMQLAWAQALEISRDPGEIESILAHDEMTIRAVLGRNGVTVSESVVGTGEPAIRYYTAREIAAMTSAEPSWIWRAFAAREAITEIDGRIKAAGKTTLALYLVGALLEGELFLGYPTAKTKVVYLTEQQPGPFRAALASASLEQREDELRVVFRRDMAEIAWAELMARVAADALRDGFGLIVVDTLGKLSGIRDENDAAQAAAAMAPLQDAAHDGLAVIVIRHERKGGGEVGESGRGSSAFSGDADVILQLRRPEGNQPRTRRVIESLSRYSSTPEKIVVELTAEGYVLLGEAEAVALADGVRIVSALIGGGFERNEFGPTLDELVEASELSRPTVQRALKELQHRQQLSVSGKGVKGDPKRYRLQEKDSALTNGLLGRNEWNGAP